MNRTLKYKIGKEDAGLRVELFLRRKGFSRQNLVEIKRCPWNSPVKNIGVGCHFLLHGLFLTQGLSSDLLLGRWVLYH